MKKLLVIGDAGSLGHGRVINSLCHELKNTWDITHIGTGTVVAHAEWDQLLPPKGDERGIIMSREVADKIKPDVIFILQDIWWLSQYRLDDYPTVVYVPVEGENVRKDFVDTLDRFSACVFYTQFGHDQCSERGFNQERHVIYHGVDHKKFYPIPREKARRMLNLPEDIFIIGNVNANQARKRLDLTVEFFSCLDDEVDAKLCLHFFNKKDMRFGYDLLQLSTHFGVSRDLILTPSNGLLSDEFMRALYNSFDIQVTTTGAEGWGLTTLEGMACGVPQVIPDFSGLGAWVDEDAGAIKVPVEGSFTLLGGINTICRPPEKRAFLDAIASLYLDGDHRNTLRKRAIKYSNLFSWEKAATEFHNLFASLIC